MSRPSLLLMSAGSGALLLALVLLWQSTRSDALPAQPTVAPRRPEAPAAASTPPPAARTRKITPSPTVVHAPPPAIHSEPAPQVPALPPTLEPTKPPPKPLTNRNLQYGATQLHAQTKAVEPLVRACVANAQGKPTGTAYVVYVVAKRGDKMIIEETGVEPSGTTIKDESLLECLHKTANAMKFVGLPRDADSIMATRKIVMKNGAVTEYKHVTFTYLR